MAAQQLLRLHRQEIAVEHGRRLDERFRQRHRRQLDRKAAGLQHAALDVLGTRAQMRVTRIDLAPGVDDADDRPAGPVVGIIAELAQPRAMTERTQVIDAEPTMAAQIFGTLAVHEDHPAAGRRTLSRLTSNMKGTSAAAAIGGARPPTVAPRRLYRRFAR